VFVQIRVTISPSFLVIPLPSRSAISGSPCFVFSLSFPRLAPPFRPSAWMSWSRKHMPPAADTRPAAAFAHRCHFFDVPSDVSSADLRPQISVVCFPISPGFSSAVLGPIALASSSCATLRLASSPPVRSPILLRSNTFRCTYPLIGIAIPYWPATVHALSSLIFLPRYPYSPLLGFRCT
jgi:hypothetical protein